MDVRDNRLFDHLIEGVQIIGRDWKYAYVNPAVCKQGRFSKEQLVGYYFHEGYPGVENTELYHHLKLCMDHGTPHAMVNKFEFPDGSIGFFELRIQAVPEGVLVLSIELSDQRKAETALKKSEDQYKQIFDGIEEIFIVHEIITNANGQIIDLRFLDINTAGEKMFGRSRSEIIGRLRSEILGPLEQGLEEILVKVAFAKESLKVERYMPGINKWFESLFYSPSDKQVASLNLDITDRKKWEEQIKQVNQELEARVRDRTNELNAALQREKQLSELKSDFLSMASHEFRTPLSTLLTSLSLLEKY